MNPAICKNPITKIYALVDPNDNTIRYVGASTNPERRYMDHLSCHGDNKGIWLNGLKKNGQRAIIKILEICPTNDRKKYENKWILKMLADGHKLYNVIYPGYDRAAHMSKFSGGRIRAFYDRILGK